ncbi:MAG TPA: shikimate kinase [Propioniciclava sp.]|uniref:shikimate kinase n=1 Tax=Propioniciclava sp. TaxID=2038686 RepID=UPI002CFAE278|nr:shikimate kinase [Propioniciclava sp.]HRL49184.1 shikimate kinase [Propioniciclava sp.]HRL79130.1 shikimate kinase [Propioniciclava sp.]
MRTIALIGAPGSGKSTLGPLLAERLGGPFVDVDTVIEQRQGRAIRDIFADDGEDAFRAIEAAVTVELLAQPGVVSLGGGAPLTPRIATALGDVATVWLQVDAHHAVARIGLDQGRPLLAGQGVRATLIALLNARTPVYRSLATVAIDTNGREPDALADAIAAALEEA